MKVKRYKRARRIISFYRNNFGFTSKPYKVLVDGTFCQQALENRINLKEQLPKYLLGDPVKLMTTKCVLKELEVLGKQFAGALHIAKQFVNEKCTHGLTVLGASECLLSLIGPSNELKYWIGTQDPDLQNSLRELSGCPLIYIKYNSLILDKPSHATVVKASGVIESRLGFEGHQKHVVSELKKQQGCTTEALSNGRKRKRKGPKGPNPLSCKKKKTKMDNGAKNVAADGGGGRRKRKRRKQAGDHTTVSVAT